MSVELQLADIRTEDAAGEYDRRGFERLSDADLFLAAVDVIAVPKRDFDSYAMHAPLELLARYLLLPYVEPHARRLARLQMLATALFYREKGESVEHCGTGRLKTHRHASRTLVDAVRDGEVMAAQEAATFLSRRLDGLAIARRLSDLLLTRLSSGAHSHIYLHLVTRLPQGLSQKAVRMLPGFIREVAKNPHQRIEAAVADGEYRRDSGRGGDLKRNLLSMPPLGRPQSSGIYGIVGQALDRQLPQSLAPVLPKPGASRETTCASFSVPCRVATLSMLQEDESHAKYGWTHCLTLPQAAWGLGDMVRDPAAAVYIANAYVAGFRSAIGKRTLDEGAVPPPSNLDLERALRVSPDAAAAAAWHCPAGGRSDLIRRLATGASIRNDCHLVKYTLACIDCMSSDRDNSHLYMAGAAKLLAIWMGETSEGDLELRLHERD